MTVSVTFNDEETNLIKSYASERKLTISKLIRDVVLKIIEDEYDLDAYNNAIKEYRKNPKTYTLDEVKEELEV